MGPDPIHNFTARHATIFFPSILATARGPLLSNAASCRMHSSPLLITPRPPRTTPRTCRTNGRHTTFVASTPEGFSAQPRRALYPMCDGMGLFSLCGQHYDWSKCGGETKVAATWVVLLVVFCAGSFLNGKKTGHQKKWQWKWVVGSRSHLPLNSTNPFSARDRDPILISACLHVDLCRVSSSAFSLSRGSFLRERAVSLQHRRLFRSPQSFCTLSSRASPPPCLKR